MVDKVLAAVAIETFHNSIIEEHFQPQMLSLECMCSVDTSFPHSTIKILSKIGIITLNKYLNHFLSH